jgi:predicted ATPase
LRSVDFSTFLISASILWDKVENRDQYPFSLPAISYFSEVQFHPKVTFFVGENGSGKSTLIEALAIAWGFNAEGGSKNFNFKTHQAHSNLNSFLRLVKSPKRARDGFFLRAESYFNVASEIEKLDAEPAYSPPIKNSYGFKSLHDQSHGESFFALLENRFGGNGLYILDEPEAALSPSRQLSMLVRTHELVKQNSQFIIATHSPILMAYPDAWIYQVSGKGLDRVDYKDTEHYQVTRDFLNRTDTMLDVLLSRETKED